MEAEDPGARHIWTVIEKSHKKGGWRESAKAAPVMVQAEMNEVQSDLLECSARRETCQIKPVPIYHPPPIGWRDERGPAVFA